MLFRSGLGSDASVVLSLRDQISALEGYVKTMELVNLRLGVQSAAMTRMDEIASTLRTRSEERRVGKECRCRWAP